MPMGRVKRTRYRSPKCSVHVHLDLSPKLRGRRSGPVWSSQLPTKVALPCREPDTEDTDLASFSIVHETKDCETSDPVSPSRGPKPQQASLPARFSSELSFSYLLKHTHYPYARTSWHAESIGLGVDRDLAHGSAVVVRHGRPLTIPLTFMMPRAKEASGDC